MPGRSGDLTRLLHIIDSIEEIKQYITGVKYEDFKNQSMMKNACIRQLEIIGEACSRISQETKSAYPQIEWHQIVGLRNILIHQYFGVDDKIVWDVIKSDMIDLEEMVRSIITDFSDSQ